jgi:hypothetical protein
MRPATWIVGSLLIFAVIVITVWPWMRSVWSGAPVPPGQYPLNKSRWAWPMTPKEAPYRPGKSMGADDISYSTDAQPKVRCADLKTCPGI